MARERFSTYEGEHLDITYDRKLCIHVAECGRSASDLFNVKNDPWCSPDAEPGETAAEIVRRCPTGALTYTCKDGSPQETPPDHNLVVVSPAGPLYVRGDIELAGRDEQGSPFRVALCRCGQSANKPFCDNAHKKDVFSDSGAVGARGPGVEAHGGKLTVKLAENGPLLLRGNFKIMASSGRIAFEGTKAALCRCGGSKNKPFCDGTHSSNGFEAPGA